MLDTIRAIAIEAIEAQATQNRKGPAKKKKAVRAVVEALDRAIQWPGPVGRLVDLVDGPLAILIGEVVEAEYRKWKKRRDEKRAEARANLRKRK